MMTAWSVYVVRCADGSLYTGIAKDVTRRVEEHNANNLLGARYSDVLERRDWWGVTGEA